MIQARVRSQRPAARARWSAVAALGAAALLAACDERENPNGPRPRYTLTIAAPTAESVGQDSTISLGAVLLDTAVTADSLQEVSGATLTYESSDAAIAEVDDEGNVTARAGGTANVTITYEDVNRDTTLTAVVPITVVPRPAQTVSLTLPAGDESPANTIYLGESRTLHGLIISTTPGDTVFCSIGANCSATVTRPAPTAENPAAVDTLDRVLRFVEFSADVDTSLVQVGEDGTVTVNDVEGAPSTFTVTMTSPGEAAAPNSASVTITVAPRPVESITVSPSPIALAFGGTAELTVSPAGAGDTPIADEQSRAVTFTSSNPAVASVDEEGVVTAGNVPGTATILVRMERTPGSGVLTGPSATVDVIVR